MHRRILVSCFALAAAFWAGAALINAPSTHAKAQWYTNWDLRGFWVSQLTGNVMFPPALPGAALNGSYCLTGRVEADGNGNATGTVYDNYNGLLLNYTWQGTYQVNKDGTLTVSTVLNLGGNAYPLTMFGVICADGNEVRLMQVGPTMGDLKIPGLPANLLGTAIVGSWTRQ